MLNIKLLKKARGEEKADLVLKNCFIVDVFNEALVKADVAISHGKIIGIGIYEGEEEVDLNGQIVCPGFIDGHLHLESAMVKVEEFASHIIPLGTTTIFADPHEIANVAGVEAIEYILDIGNRLPWNFHLMLPSCVPSTKFETSGAILRAHDLEPLLPREGVFGLGEVMSYLEVIQGDQEIWDKLTMAEGRFIDGHAPGMNGKDLNAYLLAGIQADHECTSPAEALEKVRKGMFVMIREGSATKDLESLLPIVHDKNCSRFLFATDDRDAKDILTEGHINSVIKKAISLGMEPIRAIRLATINSALALGIKDVGAIAPRYKADLVVIDDFTSFNIKKVYKDGKLVGEDGRSLFKLDLYKNTKSQRIFHSVHLGKLREESFELPLGKQYRVMELVKDQIITKNRIVSFSNNQVSTSELLGNDLVKLAVVERHHATGNVGLGLLKGYGLLQGAIASSIGHDSHNITVAGLDSKDMLLAVKEIERLQGGIVLVKNQKVIGSLSLPVAGLMSDRPMAEVAEQLDKLKNMAVELGIQGFEPFMTLAFMSLPVIPELKLTDQGLFDVHKFLPADLILES